MLYFIGDVHSLFKLLAYQISIHKITDSVLVQVGDFGAGLTSNETEVFEKVDELLKSKNNKLYVIRGNHDDPSYFFEEKKIGRISFLSDYSVIEANNKKILLVGGAISIDRRDRIEGNSYWKEESFTYNEDRLNEAVKSIDKLDIVVTHSAPSEFWPYTYANIVHTYARRDDNLLGDLVKDRESHSQLMKHLKQLDLLPKHWYYGHYHASNESTYDGIKYRALNEMEFFQHL